MNNNGINKHHLLIKNGECYTGGGFSKLDIVIDSGLISDVLAAGSVSEEGFERVIDAEGFFVLPGMIDSHTHIREPGRTDREDFVSGTAAAAAGGITAVCDMPNVSPPVYRESILQDRIHLANEKVLIDVAFYGGAGFNNLAEQRTLAAAGVAAFKTFIQPLPQGREAEFNGITACGEEQLLSILQNGAGLKRRFFFHCENFNRIAATEKELHESGVRDYSFHYKSRPPIAETEAVEMIIRLAKHTGTPIGICHVSVPEACARIKAAKAEGVDIIAETCFHYLLFDDSYIDRLGPYAKCNPPLRSKALVEELWQYLEDGTIDYIGSDHAPLLKAEKEQGKDEIWQAFSGMPSIEVMLPLLLNEVNKGRLSLTRLTELMSVNTAKVFGLYPRKGAINKGTDADFTIVDMNAEFIIDTKSMYTKNREVNIMFENIHGCGIPVYTISRGETIMERGNVNTEKAGHGQALLIKN